MQRIRRARAPGKPNTLLRLTIVTMAWFVSGSVLDLCLLLDLVLALSYLKQTRKAIFYAEKMAKSRKTLIVRLTLLSVS